MLIPKTSSSASLPHVIPSYFPGRVCATQHGCPPPPGKQPHSHAREYPITRGASQSTGHRGNPRPGKSSNSGGLDTRRLRVGAVGVVHG
ncbi:hypothetical protein BD779DRAFT_1508974 [Infundibulicybe gibba]|nr:hypothetical protein BD779DRAFT_1508974 [Infundibulicybe gibba]